MNRTPAPSLVAPPLLALALLSLGTLSGCAQTASAEERPSSTASSGEGPSADEGRPDEARAAFAKMATVFRHPRCSNCHPSDDRPRQGMQQVIHDPPVWRGPDNHGEPGAHCATCHQSANSTEARVPGAPDWHLAPIEMSWIGRSDHALCEQLKDPARNGGKSLDEVHQHLAEDPLVAWGWAPGHGREPAPGSQAELAALARTWIDAGAACPKEGAAR